MWIIGAITGADTVSPIAAGGAVTAVVLIAGVLLRNLGSDRKSADEKWVKAWDMMEGTIRDLRQELRETEEQCDRKLAEQREHAESVLTEHREMIRELRQRLRDAGL